MTRRKTYDKLPLQGNVYPMPTMAYIEDDRLRLTLLVGQPSGVASLKAGVLDVFLDRRLTADDGRGLGQGVMDNRETTSVIKLLFEPRHRVSSSSSFTSIILILDEEARSNLPDRLSNAARSSTLHPAALSSARLPFRRFDALLS